MSVIKKPDLKIFAQDAKTGEIETFPDVLRGWGITLDRTAGKPPLEWFNAIGQRTDEWLMYLTQRGVAEWDAMLSYPKTAIVQFNSGIYVSIKETKGEQPDKSQASWSTLAGFLELGNYYTKTDADTKFQPKGNYAPAGDYATNTALKNGLGEKLNTIMPEATGMLKIKNEGDYPALSFRKNYKNNGERVDIETAPDTSPISVNIIYRDKDGKNVAVVSIPKKTGFALLNTDVYTPMGWASYNGIMQYGRMEARSDRGGVNVNIADEFPIGVTAGITSMKDYIVGSSSTTYGALLTVRGWNDPTGASAQGQLFLTNSTLFGRTAYKNVDNKSQFYIGWKAYTDKNTTTDRNGNLRELGTAEHLSDCRVGIPLPWPQTTAPTGYLICNGQTFNKATYPLLALAYPSGVLPDLRGEFIRGFDAGRNVDSARTVLSAQGDAIRNITGEMYEANDRMIKFTGALYDGGFVGGKSGLGGGNAGHKVRFDASRVVPTANENRPRNIAFLYIVRAA